MVSKIDAYVLNLCTKFSHWLQRTTGLTNFFIAKIGIAILTLNLVLWSINYFHRFLTYPTRLWEVWFYGISIMFGAFRTTALDKAEDQFLSETPAINRFLSSSPVHRLAWLCLTIVDLGFACRDMKHASFKLLQFCSSTFSLGIAIFYYFATVRPLPPGKSRIREWIESWGMSRAVPVPAEH